MMFKTNNDYHVAVLYICTGKYRVFWKEFYKSFEKNFLKSSIVEYFVFTDADEIFAKKNMRVHKIYQEQLGWPGATLYRFHMFLKIEKELTKFDYIFFFNSNCICKKKITEKEFLPVEEKLLFVQHPGMYNKSSREFTYERNAESTAYISESEGNVYVMGAVNGGSSAEYLKLMKQIRENIDKDDRKKIVARYHDESHLNRYCLSCDKYKLLSPSYCYPEGWKLPFKNVITLLEKDKYFDVREYRKMHES